MKPPKHYNCRSVSPIPSVKFWGGPEDGKTLLYKNTKHPRRWWYFFFWDETSTKVSTAVYSKVSEYRYQFIGFKEEESVERFLDE